MDECPEQESQFGIVEGLGRPSMRWAESLDFFGESADIPFAGVYLSVAAALR